MAVVCLVGVINMFIEDEPVGAFLLGIFFFFLCTMSMYMFDSAASTPVVTYKVLIDDSVSMNEFLSYFKIIEVEGKIYTIIPR